METIYYSLDAKRLTVCAEAAGQRASGGQETVCYAFVPRPRRQERRAPAKVVQFEAYRRGAGEAWEEAPEEAPVRQEREPGNGGRDLRLGLALDLIATAAIVCVAAAAVLRFLSF